jgi:hypothetical protein
MGDQRFNQGFHLLTALVRDAAALAISFWFV